MCTSQVFEAYPTKVEVKNRDRYEHNILEGTFGNITVSKSTT